MGGPESATGATGATGTTEVLLALLRCYWCLRCCGATGATEYCGISALWSVVLRVGRGGFYKTLVFWFKSNPLFWGMVFWWLVLLSGAIEY